MAAAIRRKAQKETQSGMHLSTRKRPKERFTMIGILYESNEWSDHKLAAEVKAHGIDVRLINLEDPASEQATLDCDLLVSRVFASAQFRDHAASLERMPRIAEEADRSGISLVNPARAHFFETDKRLATQTLAEAGFVTPRVFACGKPNMLNPATFSYPCVIKPNCGGRTTCTTIAHNAAEAQKFLEAAPFIDFIVQEYIEPVRGFLTRIEIVDGTCALIVKRSIAANGLSAYHLGSTYELYDDCSNEVKQTAERAARTLSFELGSFDLIEGDRGPCIIDANSVSNVSEDCTDLFGLDLMAEHAAYLARRYRMLKA